MTLDVDYFFDSIKKGDNEHRIEALLEMNPDLADCTNSNGFTPLIYATYVGNVVSTKILIKHKAKIDKQDVMGNTALIGVCFKGNEELAQLLLEHGADINARNNKGMTSLIMATMYNNKGIVKMLVAHRADKTIKDYEGKAAFDYAQDKELRELLKF